MIKTAIIDERLCIQCGKCIEVCPKSVLEMKDGVVTPNVEECMLCSHCHSVCKTQAISFDENALHAPHFKSFEYKPEVLTEKDIDNNNLVNIIRSRRSIRNFKKQKISDDILDDLISFAVTAPSGSNCQDWEFLIINGNEKVWNLAFKFKTFFEKLNRYAKNPFIRTISPLFMGNKLKKYYKNNLETVTSAIEEAEKGNDLLFHGAEAIIMFHSKMDGSTPVEDAQYTSYNVTLLAHAMGIGTCYIGYAVEAINRAPEIKDELKIPKENRVHAVLSLGYFDNNFSDHPLRKPQKVKKL